MLFHASGGVTIVNVISCQAQSAHLFPVSLTLEPEATVLTFCSDDRYRDHNWHPQHSTTCNKIVQSQSAYKKNVAETSRGSGRKVDCRSWTSQPKSTGWPGAGKQRRQVN